MFVFISSQVCSSSRSVWPLRPKPASPPWRESTTTSRYWYSLVLHVVLDCTQNLYVFCSYCWPQQSQILLLTCSVCPSLCPRRPRPGSKVAPLLLTGPSRGSWCSGMWR